MRVERAEHVDQAASSSRRVIQARSSGRKPLFFWLPRQFLRSISWCAMLTSPTRMNSRSAFSASGAGTRVQEAELGGLPLFAAGPAGKVAADDAELAAAVSKRAST
jgi:hypothetical protein